MLSRSRFATLILALLVSPAVCPVRVRAQAPPPLAASPDAAHPRSITLDVVVKGRSGPPVPGLQQRDFTLLDNKTPRAITSFRAVGGSTDPVEVTLVVDAVNTSFQVVASEREQIGRFLRANEGRLPQPTSLAIFTDAGMQVQQSATTDGNALAVSLEHADIGLRDIRRSSGIYGADERTQLSLTALTQLITRLSSRPGRKIVLWVSPGWPLLSGPAIQLTGNQQRQIFGDVVSFSTRLRQAHVRLYATSPIGAVESVSRSMYYESFLKGVTKPEQTDIADLSLQVLAVQSGGLALNGSNDVGQYMKDIYQEASASYELTFDPAPADHANEYHGLELQVDRPGLTARTNQGYYAQP